MNRRSNATIEDAARVKVMLHYKIPTIEIAKQTPFTPAAISNINTGKAWKDVKVDMKLFSAGQCIGCGKLLIDGLDDLIYLVADDEYVCDQRCLDRINA